MSHDQAHGPIASDDHDERASLGGAHASHDRLIPLRDPVSWAAIIAAVVIGFALWFSLILTVARDVPAGAQLGIFLGATVLPLVVAGIIVARRIAHHRAESADGHEAPPVYSSRLAMIALANLTFGALFFAFTLLSSGGGAEGFQPRLWVSGWGAAFIAAALAWWLRRTSWRRAVKGVLVTAVFCAAAVVIFLILSALWSALRGV